MSQFNPFTAYTEMTEASLRPFIDFNLSVAKMMESMSSYNDSISSFSKPFIDYQMMMVENMQPFVEPLAKMTASIADFIQR